MTLKQILQKEIEAFEKKFADTIIDVVWFGDNPLLDEIKSFLRQSLNRLLEAQGKELMERVEGIKNHTEMTEMDGTKYTEGFEKAVFRVQEIFRTSLNE